MPNKSSNSVKVSYPKWTTAELVQILQQRLPQLHAVLPLVRVILFGSYAKGNFTAYSDIDLLVVYSGQPRDDAFALTKKILALRGLEPHLYTESEYHQHREVIDRMTQDGIVLFPPTEK